MKNYVLVIHALDTGSVKRVLCGASPFDEETLSRLVPAGHGHLLTECEDLREVFPQGSATDYRVVEGALVYEPADPDGPVKEARKRKCDAIDKRTDAIIALGYPFRGLWFSTSLEAQTRALGMDQLRNDPAMQYPIAMNSLDDAAVVLLLTADDVHEFALSGIGYYRVAIDSGTDLKDQVRAATTVEDVNAIVDPR